MWHADAGRGGVRALAYAPDGGSLYAVTGAGRVQAWDAATAAGRELFRVSAPYTADTGLSIPPNTGDVLVYTRAITANPFWTWDTAQDRLVFPTDRDEALGAAYTFADSLVLPRAVRTVAFSGAGRLIYIHDDSGLIRAGYVLTGVPAANRHFGRITWDLADFAGAADGSRLALATGRGTVVIWDTAADVAVSTVKLPFGTHPAAIAVSGAGVLAVSLQDELRFYDAATGTPTAAPLVARPATLIALSPASDVALTADGTAAVTVWRGGSPAGRFDWKVGRVRALAIAPDGLTAAVGGTQRTFAVVDLDV